MALTVVLFNNYIENFKFLYFIIVVVLTAFFTIIKIKFVKLKFHIKLFIEIMFYVI